MQPSTAPTRAQIAELRRRLAQEDPLLLEAADEVDRELLRWMLSLTPLQRLDVASKASGALARFHHDAT
jgi:hypothetical protein